MENKNVTVFSTPTCVYCIVLKRWLDEKGVSYSEVDVSQDEEAQREMVQKTGQMGVPVLMIDEEVVVGFDRERIAKILNIQD
ncbi:MAG: glutaredoxin family protein [Patescibacteria group bacterium]|jgi:glutaredoxin 3|nr:glutaredoxin family protein [Patescibacteria group bacterium]